MLTLGDVLAVVASLAGGCVTAWALLMGVSLLFGERVGRARDALALNAKRSLVIGFLTTLIVGGFGLGLINVPNPAVKLVGWAMLLFLLSYGTIGAAGLAALAAERIQTLDGAMNAYQAQIRGTLFVCASGLFPILGWFLVAPAVLVMGVGAGMQTLRATRTVGFEV